VPAERAAPEAARNRTTAGDRLRRLLAIIPWIAASDGPTVAEVCRRFGVTRAQLLADLQVVFLVGLHPFTPDELIDVELVDDRVWIRLNPGAFAKPLQLTPEQGLGLVAAGTALLAVEGSDADGPLARGLHKLADLLGIDADDALAVSPGPVRREVLELLRGAVTDQHQVELDYYAYGRDQRSVRVVDPHRVFAEGGQWYLAAHCHASGGDRLFRLDRVQSARALEEAIEVPAPPVEPGVFHPRPEDPRVTLELSPAAAWVVDQYAVEEVEALDDGRLRVRLAVSAVPWLERLLLRLGAECRVVAADAPLPDDLVTRAARRVLARYRRPAP
jgi:proteasome accessory factor C